MIKQRMAILTKNASVPMISNKSFMFKFSSFGAHAATFASSVPASRRRLRSRLNPVASL
jgi:hypothetical protein